ncbi:CinA family protein [Zavarzinia sp. CC-PAN008]|uniref:CinA family protein n=1 Tax=Zavarzinia sp. CC-PAN008 TaxID=3243332 RepID=UPI003F74475A
MSIAPDLAAAATDLLAAMRARGLRIATVESCTGGLIAACLTEIPGSSDVVDRGFVTYSNEAKSELVGVPADLIAAVGAVSEDVARAMAEGALARSRADLAVSCTGVAGPGGGSAAKPVGLVHIACASRDGTQHRQLLLGDLGRAGIREATVAQVFDLAHEVLAGRT